MSSRLRTLTIVLFAGLPPCTASAQLSSAERALLARLDVARTTAVTRRFSEEIVDNRSGAGAGSVVAGSPDEKLVANVIEQEFRKMGIASVRQEPFPVRHYQYGEVVLTADGEPIEAVSLHAAGGTWGTRDGVPYARGNEGGGRSVRAELVDVGAGYLADYVAAGDVGGKVVLVRRGGGWPTYQILEAAHRGAAALILYDYRESLEEALKQDSMWYHEQLSTVSIRTRDARRLQDELMRGPVEIVLENRIDVADGTSQNVVATVRGTELPDEWIVMSAHYDRWFQAAQDNSVGVAVMLELARAFSSDYTPRRSLMFVGVGAEEAGVEATESDWLAGSLAFVRAHPDVTRSMAFTLNIDTAGWTADRGLLAGTHDVLPFLRQVVADLGLEDRLTVSGGMSSNVDAWNYGSVGGGAVGYIFWGDPFSGGSYTQYYHTQLDLYRPEDYENLPHDLRVGALSVNRIDQATILPIHFSGIAEWARAGPGSRSRQGHRCVGRSAQGGSGLRGQGRGAGGGAARADRPPTDRSAQPPSDERQKRLGAVARLARWQQPASHGCACHVALMALTGAGGGRAGRRIRHRRGPRGTPGGESGGSRFTRSHGGRAAVLVHQRRLERRLRTQAASGERGCRRDSPAPDGGRAGSGGSASPTSAHGGDARTARRSAVPDHG